MSEIWELLVTTVPKDLKNMWKEKIHKKGHLAVFSSNIVQPIDNGPQNLIHLKLF